MTPPLLHAVDPLLEPENMAIGDVKTGGHLHIDLLIKVSIEVGSLDIHLVDLQVALGGECKYSVEWRELRYRSESLVEVDAFNLCEPLSDEVSLILLNTAIWASFDAENPLASDDLLSLRLRYNVVHI